MKNHKDEFLRNEVLTFTAFRALERAETYLDSTPIETKVKLRDVLRKKLEKLGEGYSIPVPNETHLANIVDLSDELSAQFRGCLREGRFRIGIAQKALNLYLKYLWCLGQIPLPPHCPFDSRVISRLPACRGLNWIDIDDIKLYMQLVKVAKNTAGERSLAEWELENETPA
jgi:hypothetical protein